MQEPTQDRQLPKKILSTQSSLERSTSPLKETHPQFTHEEILQETKKLDNTISQAVNDIGTLRVRDLESSQHQNLLLHDDIDAFIRNAKLIQTSINEALSYEQTLDPQVKEEI